MFAVVLFANSKYSLPVYLNYLINEFYGSIKILKEYDYTERVSTNYQETRSIEVLE